MARRHVVEYFLEQQALLVDMVHMLEQYNSAYEEGFLTDEQYDAVKNEIKVCKENYEFLAYIMMLLNKPNRDKRLDEINKNLYSRLSGVSKEAILDESRNALADVERILKEADEKMKESQK